MLLDTWQIVFQSNSKLKSEIQDASCPLQTCAGYPDGIEAAAHAKNSLYSRKEVLAILLVDAENALKKLNRAAALRNFLVTLHSLSPFFPNTYRGCDPFSPAKKKFLLNKEQFKEMWQQCASTDSRRYPWSLCLQNRKPNACFGAGAGTISSLREWWQLLLDEGPGYGFHPNASKSYLIVKPNHIEEATEQFRSTNVQITCNGKKYLGGFFGPEEGKGEYLSDKCGKFEQMVCKLSSIAEVEPHVAYSGFTVAACNANGIM